MIPLISSAIRSMRTARECREVGLYGWYGHGNVGDELMREHIASLIAEAAGLPPRVYGYWQRHRPLPRWAPSARGRVQLSRRLNSTARRIVCPIVVAWMTRHLAALVFGGGTLLGHSGRERGSIPRVASLVQFLAGQTPAVALYLYGIGVGYARPSEDYQGIRDIAASAAAVIVRDSRSLSIFLEAGAGDNVQLGVDPLYAIVEPSSTRSSRLEPGLLIAPRLPDWAQGIPAVSQRLVQTFVSTARKTADDGHAVGVVPFCPSLDRALCSYIVQEVAVPNCRLLATPQSIDEFRGLRREYGSLLAAPLHAAMLGTMLHFNVLPLVYHPKCSQFAEEVGLSEIALDCNSDDTIPDAATLLRHISGLPAWYKAMWHSIVFPRLQDLHNQSKTMGEELIRFIRAILRIEGNIDG